MQVSVSVLTVTRQSLDVWGPEYSSETPSRKKTLQGVLRTASKPALSHPGTGRPQKSMGCTQLRRTHRERQLQKENGPDKCTAVFEKINVWTRGNQ